ncbi:hypothetical protein N7528_000223 [Penicillium herquei]|nr:hypothetical protein N7528_000223 [Penicillium herquei]
MLPLHGEAVGDEDWDETEDDSLETLEEAMGGLTAERARSWIDLSGDSAASLEKTDPEVLSQESEGVQKSI